MELEILLRRMKPQETEPPVIDQPPKRNAFEQSSILLSIAPSFTMALPMLLGFYLMHRANRGMGAAYMTMGLTTAVGSVVLGTIWAVIGYNRRRAKMRFAERLRKRTYRAYLRQSEQEIKEQIHYLENLMRNLDPPFAEWIDTIRQRVRCAREIPKTGRYNLKIRLGTGSQIYPVTMERSTHLPGADILEREAQALIKRLQILNQVPVYLTCGPGMRVDLLTERCSDQAGQFQTLVIRTALTYHDQYVKITFCLHNPILLQKLSHLLFLPHVVPPDEPKVLTEIREDAVILCFAEEGSQIPIHLQNDARLILIFLKPADTESATLQGSETQCIQCTRTFHGLIGEDGERREIDFDAITDEEAELASRTLCRLRNEENAQNELPKIYPFFHMIPQETLDIARNWMHTDVLHSLKVPIGITYEGRLTCLDAHDKRDGPHGLIAGMTGSGKSELLMTYILSLSVKYPPWEVAFFLIDYKGGGMSSAFSRLPHVIGSISNLSGRTIRRAFLSIRSENERRQRLFLANNVNHISDYHRKYYEGTCSEALPHIFLIVDEFAQLKNEEPEFMQELIGLSRVGRSLGIHLLLCTQKPSGSVDSTIMTNARFQIALRLQDPLDSKEILHHPDAADLKNPGRAILRIGNDEVYETFQGAYALSPAQEGKKRHVYPADPYGRMLHEADAVKDSLPAANAMSSMDYLLDAILDADGKIKASGHYPNFTRSLWLAELPETLRPTELMKRTAASGPGGITDDPIEIGKGTASLRTASATAIVIGLYDDPGHVTQGPVYLDHKDGHHLICGMPRSGKSTLLCVYLTGLMCMVRHPNVYVFDCGGGTLRRMCKRYEACQEAVRDAAQEEGQAQVVCVSEEEKEQIAPALEKLQKEEDAVVVIDGLGVMLQAGGFAVAEQLTELVRNGARRRISVIISANGIGMGEMSQMMLTYMDRCLCLRMSDTYRYAEVLKEGRFKGVADLPPGRGYVKTGERIVEFQTLSESEENHDFYRCIYAGQDKDAFSAG